MQLFSSAGLLLLTQVSVCRCAPGANLTSNLDVKIVFTPMRTGTSRTVKRYPSSTGSIISNSLPNGNGHYNGNGRNGHRPITNGHNNRQVNNVVAPAVVLAPSQANQAAGPEIVTVCGPLRMQLFSSAALLLLTQVSVCRCAPGANLTSNLDRIKIVFTPMVCRRVCSGGHCYNSCEKGDITTVYIFCQIPCLNGGRCIGRDQCWCPLNSTGKFCHLPAPPSARPTLSRKDGSLAGLNSSSHSILGSRCFCWCDGREFCLTNCAVRSVSCPASLHPSLVNVHIQHPHEAEVQIHQVARVKPGQRPATAEGGHSIQQRSQPGHGTGNGHGHSNGNGHGHGNRHGNGHTFANGNGSSNSRPHSRQNGYVGRCFQETVDGQCGKPLPGLTKQDECCGSVGASWGLNKCTECPTKPSKSLVYPHILNTLNQKSSLPLTLLIRNAGMLPGEHVQRSHGAHINHSPNHRSPGPGATSSPGHRDHSSLRAKSDPVLMGGGGGGGRTCHTRCPVTTAHYPEASLVIPGAQGGTGRQEQALRFDTIISDPAGELPSGLTHF
ncbi:unnamed protein product [Coregonus sp. 'balchen']|nr:unnamed protein product [Coregonus sp. 'balchen']